MSESLLLETASVLVETGLRDLGYQYVVLDDCWSRGRDEDSHLLADPEKFPRGMKAVAQSLHDNGLLFGMYSSAGELTCARYAGSLDYEKQDAESFASWEVDYLKYDNCYHMGRMGTPQISFNRFNEMSKALKSTDRPILYSLCSWGEDYVHTWGGSIANSWRISGDIYDSFARPDDLCACENAADPHCVAPGTHCSVLAIINKVAPFVDRGLPGGWNDLDMLEVGVGGMSYDEYKAHFSMWAALKSPLMLGSDLRKMTPETFSIISNPAIIALNQDPLGRSVQRVQRNLNVAKDEYGIGETHVWSGPLANGDQVVIFLNAADEPLTMSVKLSEVFVMFGVGGTAAEVGRNWVIRDLWENHEAEDAGILLDMQHTDGGSGHHFRPKVYNATLTSYAAGLAERDPRLFGRRIGEVHAGGTISIRVERHAAKVFRLQHASDERPREDQGNDEL